MKQGTQFVLPVEIGMSLDEISRIEFVFKQKNYNGFPAVEAYAITDTNPSVSFRRTDGAIKIWGYGTMTSSGGWGQQTTSLIAFAGDKYYKSAMYGGPSSTGLSLSISNGKLSGLPSGLTAINAVVTRGI